MDSKLGNPGFTLLGLSLVALTTLGLLSRMPASSALPSAVEAAAAHALPTVIEAGASTAAPSPPAQDGTHHRHALSMPYFSFARLLRPGS